MTGSYPKMKIKVLYPRRDKEQAQAARALLEWQGNTVHMTPSEMDVLKITKGEYIPLFFVTKDNQQELVAKGYKELLEWMDREGLWRI